MSVPVGKFGSMPFGFQRFQRPINHCCRLAFKLQLRQFFYITIKTIRANSVNFNLCDRSDQRWTRHRMDGLQIGRAADELAWLAPLPFKKHGQRAFHATGVKSDFCRSISSWSTRRRPDFTCSGNWGSSAAGVPGRGEYLNE